MATRVNRADVARAVSTLGKAYGHPVDDDLVTLYLAGLSGLTAEQLAAGLVAVVHGCRYWPKVADILASVPGQAPGTQSGGHYGREDCVECDGTGWAYSAESVQSLGLPCRQARRCTCSSSG